LSDAATALVPPLKLRQVKVAGKLTERAEQKKVESLCFQAAWCSFQRDYYFNIKSGSQHISEGLWILWNTTDFKDCMALDTFILELAERPQCFCGKFDKCMHFLTIFIARQLTICLMI
jgi:hypothetical protein